MIFKRAGRNRNNTRFLYNGTEIEIVNKFTYLGIVFTTGGSFKETQNALAGQALKGIYKLKSYVYKLTDLTLSHMIELFDKLILPILSYGSEISNVDKTERVHLQFCKQLLGVKTQTQTTFIYGELSSMPLQKMYFMSIIRFWIKILHSNELKYVNTVYKMMLHDMVIYPNKISWAVQVKHLLQHLGFNDAWLQQSVGNINRFIQTFKQRLKDIYIQTWHTQIESSTRANSYKLFCDFNFKPYLNCVTVKKYRFSLSRLRVSSHRLAIESGRWHKPNIIPLNERKCQYCNKLEDEFHFLLECPLYTHFRKKSHETILLE